MDVIGPLAYWWWVNIGSGNGLVLSKPLPEPVLTQIYVKYGINMPQWVDAILK